MEKSEYFSTSIRICTMVSSMVLVTLIRSYRDKLALFGTLNIRLFVTIVLLLSHIQRPAFPVVSVSYGYKEKKTIILGLIASLEFCHMVIYLFFHFPDLTNEEDQKEYDRKTFTSTDIPESPEYFSNILSKITYWWFNSIVRKGYKNNLTTNDLWDLKKTQRTPYVGHKFLKGWKKALGDKKSIDSNVFSENKIEENIVQKVTKKSGIQIVVTAVNDDEEIQQSPISKYDDSSTSSPDERETLINRAIRKTKRPSLSWIIFKQFFWRFFPSIPIKFICDCLLFVSPILLKKLLRFINDSDAPKLNGYLCAIAMFLAIQAHSILLQHYYTLCFTIGLNIKSTLSAAIYAKTLKLNNVSKSSYTVGEVVNLLSIDCSKIYELVPHLNMIWSSPFQISICLYMLWQLVGPSVLAGTAFLVVILPINAVIIKYQKKFQTEQLKFTDSRIKLVNQMLNGIKVLKLYAWEKLFEEKIAEKRSNELDVLKRAAYLNSFGTFVWTCAPIMVSLATFSLFVLINKENKMDAEKAFVSLSLFNIMRLPLVIFPTLISNIVQTRISMKRIWKYLLLDEIDETGVTRAQYNLNCSNAITVREASFAWIRDDDPVQSTDNLEKIKENVKETIAVNARDLRIGPILHDINLEIPQSSFVAVIGAVASGKSSLLSAILGNMEKISGTVDIMGKVAYVSQQAWIQNASIKSNITKFGKGFDQDLYDKVIEACALKLDFDMFPSGDLSNIGEKGINLSGGQKQRIALARAVYADQDVYLLDDPLAAVDVHVGKHLFENVIGKTGLLGGKTKILVTNSLEYLEDTDFIYVIEEGRIILRGNYENIKNESFFLSLKEKKNKVENLQNRKKRACTDRNRPWKSESNISSKTNKAKNSISLTTLLDSSLTFIENEFDNVPAPSINNLTKELEEESSVEKNNIEKVNKEEAARKMIMGEENIAVGKVKISVFLNYIKAAGYHLCFLVGLLFILNNFCSLGANYWLSAWSEDEQLAKKNQTTQYSREARLGIYGALGIGQGLLEMLASFSIAISGVRASKYIHQCLLESTIKSRISKFEKTPSALFLNRFSSDMNTVDLVIHFTLRSCINILLQTLIIITVTSLTAYFLSIYYFLAAIFYYFVQRYYISCSRQLKRIESASKSPLYSNFSETFAGSAIIQAYNDEKNFISKFALLLDKSQNASYAGIIANRWLALRLEFIGNLLVLITSVLAVYRKSDLNAGLVGLSITYALNITQVLNWLVRMSSELETNIVAVERIKEYSDLPSEASWESNNLKNRKDWPENGEIDINNFSLRYDKSLPLVLENINLSIKSGEKIGIVGRTGAGKSSFLLGLLRLIEAESGSIFIDNIDISSIGLHELRKKLTIIPQDPVVFTGSLRWNLDPSEKASDPEIWNALEKAHLSSTVINLKEKLNFDCDEGGENLSVGQRQLICLARALLRKSKILLLDEATAAVDLATDCLIQKTINEEFNDSTVITIAHRLHTVISYDKVLVLDQGKIAEFDKPSHLLANKSSMFYTMAKEAKIENIQ
ncbi:DgyrCDS7955 [Dimorphilus gyrociliatus]|uniref:ABC-type glutathione-S-conjugate transporter n=1 Tax=Dimorphilus gyrociliatus TaxID=2664684 RepID=A0A7I8VV55_9ANNE|nr:DgyrCDS7955 [Dimorphilus gyrociliatus]